MTEAAVFYDVAFRSLNCSGEELCGDQVKLLRTADRTLVALASGPGFGVQAAIPARLTAEIIITMLREAAPLEAVMDTLIGTMPRRASASGKPDTGEEGVVFAVAQVWHATGRFQLVRLDSPAPLFLQGGRGRLLEVHEKEVRGRRLSVSEVLLQRGDFIGLMSDGLNWQSAAHRERLYESLQEALRTHTDSAEAMVAAVLRESGLLEIGAGGDATFVGISARVPRRLMVFTGPPLDKSRDAACAQKFLAFQGRRVICGGTTSNIVAEQVGDAVHTDLTTTREDLPPVGSLTGVDLVTEGILTLARALELIKQVEGNPACLALDRNAGVLLARELLLADTIWFLSGESVNPSYQNPQLPRSISIRRSLVTQLAEQLGRFQKQTHIEWV